MIIIVPFDGGDQQEIALHAVNEAVFAIQADGPEAFEGADQGFGFVQAGMGFAD